MGNHVDLTLGERIHLARVRAGFDQATVAESLRVSRPLVSKWERDLAVPDLSRKIRLALLLRQPLEVFCDLDDMNALGLAFDLSHQECARHHRARAV
jgi:transcriptional regulator with XRE-family HTH domain